MSLLKVATSDSSCATLGSSLAAERADRLPGVGETVANQLAGAVDRRTHLRARLLALGQLARPLQLDRRPGERVGEHVVQLARDPAALGDCRRPQLLLARVLELGEQQLGRVLARTRLLDEVGDQPEQHAQQRPGDDRRGRAAGERRGETEPDRHRSPDREPERQRQPRDRHPHRGAAGKRGRPARLQRDERHPGRAHRSDHARLHRQAAFDEAPPHCERKRDREHDQSGSDPEPVTVPGGRGVPVDRADHDRGDDDQAERAEDVALAAQPLIGARAGLRLACALGRIHG